MITRWSFQSLYPCQGKGSFPICSYKNSFYPSHNKNLLVISPSICFVRRVKLYQTPSANLLIKRVSPLMIDNPIAFIRNKSNQVKVTSYHCGALPDRHDTMKLIYELFLTIFIGGTIYYYELPIKTSLCI